MERAARCKRYLFRKQRTGKSVDANVSEEEQAEGAGEDLACVTGCALIPFIVLANIIVTLSVLGEFERHRK